MYEVFPIDLQPISLGDVPGIVAKLVGTRCGDATPWNWVRVGVGRRDGSREFLPVTKLGSRRVTNERAVKHFLTRIGALSSSAA